MPSPRASAATVRRIERASGQLASEAMARVEATLPWFRAMSAEDRSWITLVAQAGIGAFVAWSRRPDAARAITAEVFGSAPRELARVVTLQQTVELVRTTIEVVEEHSAELAAPGDEAQLREAVLVFAREVAFAAAEVYAQAAEVRGAWDARLESLLADAVMRGDVGDDDLSRAAALGWSRAPHVFAMAGTTPDATAATVVDALRRAARHNGLDAVSGVHGHELICVLGGTLGEALDPLPAASALVAQFGPGQVVVGPVVDDLTRAVRSVAAARAGLRAAAGWPDAPRPVAADALLPERALDGDAEARRTLVQQVYRPLAEAGGGLLETAAAVLEQSPSLEAAARALFVHANTVRYRLRRITDVSGLVPTEPRDAFTLRVALTLGRLDEHPPPIL
jgi:DNA-binding PucR family transcriptional regulator